MGLHPSIASVLANGQADSTFAIRRHPKFGNGVKQNPPELQTMQDFQKLTVKKFANQPYLGHREKTANGFANEYIWQTYAEADQISINFGAGLWSLGIYNKFLVGVYSDNSHQWIYAIDSSCYYGFCIVSLYDTLGSNAATYIIGHSEMQVILVSAARLPNLISILKENKFEVRIVILMDQETFPLSSASELDAINIKSFTFLEVAKIGSDSPVPFPKIESSDLHFICYSSGTMGNPKGVLVSHYSNLSNQLSAAYVIPLKENARYLSYLPLAHVFERAAHGLVQFYGGRYGFTCNGVRSIVEDMGILKPTFITFVPRVANRFYDSIHTKIRDSSFVKKLVFWGAFYAKSFCLDRGLPVFLFDAVVFNQIKKNMGGFCEQFICGSAATSGEVSSFLQICTGAPFRCGYGLTEAGSGNICQNNRLVDCIPNTVGGPLPNVEIRLDPIPDYFDKEAGELLIGGPCICSGYFKDEKSSNELFVDEERKWIRTGDVAKLNELGHVLIVDRLRSIFKLSQGEYVAADYLTSIYESPEIVSQIFIYGDSSRSFLVAIVIPSKVGVAKFLGKDVLADSEYIASCKTAELEKHVLTVCNQTAKEKGVLGFALLKAVRLDVEEWTTGNDLMTPTFKLKRRLLQIKYQSVITQLYDENEPK